MPAEIVTLPCLSDNYAYLMHDSDSGETALIDAPEAQAVERALSIRGWRLTYILLTHHHWDHVDGVEALRKHTKAKVIGAAADAQRLPKLDFAVAPGDEVTVAGETATVIDVPGHTVGHIAFHFTDARALFTADSLMALGCGRLFEGTPEQMWSSLMNLASLPDDTIVYSGHEYTQTNARFALTIEPDNPALVARAEDIDAARQEHKPTVPSLLSLEKATNPFLRAHIPEIKANLGMEHAADSAVFAEIRRRKDSF